MKDYKYILEPYKSSKSRYKCPSCGKASQFTKYVNIEVSEYVGENVGICNRVDKCGYHLTPKAYLQRFDRFSGGSNLSVQNVEPITPLLNRYNEQLPTTFLDRETLVKSYQKTADNNFLKYLKNLFDERTMLALKKEYLIGSSERDSSRVDFFQIDINKNIRQLKNIGYDPITGKKQNVFFTFPKSKYPDYNLVQCFFGEHLLSRYPNKKVALVESEKTAIIASIYINEFVWLAAGNANGLNHKKTEVLKGRDVILYPDLGQYDSWQNKIASLDQQAKYEISRVLELKATKEQRSSGCDLADFLIQVPLSKFRNKEPEGVEKFDPTFDKCEFETALELVTETEFSKDINNIQEYFKGLDKNDLLPMEIASGVIWSKPAKTIDNYLNIIGNSKNEKAVKPYYHDLIVYKNLLQATLN